MVLGGIWGFKFFFSSSSVVIRSEEFFLGFVKGEDGKGGGVGISDLVVFVSELVL